MMAVEHVVGRNRTSLAVPSVTGMVFERVLGEVSDRVTSSVHNESRAPRLSSDAIGSRFLRNCVQFLLKY